MALAIALGGCADLDVTPQSWFAKPLDITGRNAGGYSFSELAESKQRRRPITANDLVDSNGGCPPQAAAQPAAPTNQAPNPVPPADNTSLLGGGVALGMSECDVVSRAGAPSRVEIGKNPNGDRTAVLTYTGGPRPGVYHFERGQLMTMDRVAVPVVATEPTKKKAAKAAKPPKKSDQS